MKKTENYELALCNDGSKKFKEWREEINGTADSNMMKIDRLIKDLDTSLSKKISVHNVVLCDWQDTTMDGFENYVWTSVVIEGASSASAVVVMPSADATENDKALLRWYGIRPSSNYTPAYPGVDTEKISEDTIWFVSNSLTAGDGLLQSMIPVTIVLFG